VRFVTCVGAVVAASVLAVTLAACTSSAPGARPTTPTQTAWTLEPSAGPTAGASTVYIPKGSADDNRAAFDAAVKKVLAAHAHADGNAVAAALKAVGFPMAATQVSASKTSANLQPGSISVAVKVGGQCLIGQWGSAVGGYHSTVAPALGSGGCLIGGIAPVA
jgi:hypothetical protein